MCRIEIGQEIFYIHNHYWKDGDELPEVKVGIVMPKPQGMEDAPGHSVRPKEHRHIAIATKYFQDRDVFTTKQAACDRLFEVIKEKIKDHQTGIHNLQTHYQEVEKQLVEELGREDDVP